MAPRASSPAISENEFDITNALFGGDEVGESKKGASTDLDINLDIGGGNDGSDDEAFIAATQAASNRKSTNVKGNSVKKGGGFQSMGLGSGLLKAITKKGFSVPTPIQRKAIPLILDNQDVVGMARTGSGKTGAFVIPMVEKLKAHSGKFGARALIMSPSRELALQTLKVVKDFARGTDLRTILLVGGDSLEDQFNSMTTNPDIIIATPGRFLHLLVEMSLDLSSVKYVCFDECDRLFEMGFASQLSEILVKLPTSRQTLLFSATLPKTLVEFARAGLQEPHLVRLDAESKISPDLKSSFFSVASGDRDGALLFLLDSVIKMPVGATDAAKNAHGASEKNSKKRKRVTQASNLADTNAFSTIIFCSTKHRVDYLTNLLRAAGYSVSYIYGNLDQTARKQQIEAFRAGLTNIFVATDVAARGVDIPLLNYVINYDFPSQPKIYVHRVGRTARAGRTGWSYSLCRRVDVPYVLDLQLFLGKPLVLGRTSEEPNFAEEFVVGSLAQHQLEPSVELVNKLLADDEDLAATKTVSEKGERQYTRTRNQASAESAKRAKEVVSSPSFQETHMLFKSDVHDALREKEKMLERISGFRPAETVFEIGKRGQNSETAEIMRRRREQVDKQKMKKEARDALDDEVSQHYATAASPGLDGDVDMEGEEDAFPGSASDTDDNDDELEVSVSQSKPKKSNGTGWQNDESEFFMGYVPKGNDAVEDKGYGVHSGSAQNSNFVSEARTAAMDMANDEIAGFKEASRARGLRWDKKKKDYVSRANDEDGSKGAKMVRGESGMKIAASFRSGRFDDWRRANKTRMPRVGELEAPGRPTNFNTGRHYKHKGEKAPKEADKYRDDYHTQKKKVQEAKEKRIGKFKDGVGAKSELKGVKDIHKQRQIKEQRKQKNARPSKKRKF